MLSSVSGADGHPVPTRSWRVLLLWFSVFALALCLDLLIALSVCVFGLAVHGIVQSKLKHIALTIGWCMLVVFVFLPLRRDTRHSIDISQLKDHDNENMFFQLGGVYHITHATKKLFPRLDPGWQGNVTQVPIELAGLWGSEAAKLAFLLHYIDNPRMTSPYACILEQDCFVDRAFFRETLLRERPLVSHVQHFWGHTSFERINTACFCVAKTQPLRNYMVLHLMYFMFSSPYMSVTPAMETVLLIAKRFVFYWDRDGGCTYYDPDRCHYLHFTFPKAPAIQHASTFTNDLQWEMTGANSMKMKGS